MTMEVGTSKKQKLDDAEDGFLDHISHLPTDLFGCIVSLLHTEDIVRASLVSKTWKSLFLPMSVLDFDYDRFAENSGLGDEENRFAEFVERTIELHEGMHLERLRLVIDISIFGEEYTEIANWFSSATTIDLTALELDIQDGGEIHAYDDWNILHELLAYMPNITELTLTSPYLQVTKFPDEALVALKAGEVHEKFPAPQLPNLKHLTLKYSTLLFGFVGLGSFLRFSPNLETLRIDVTRESVSLLDSHFLQYDDEGSYLEDFFPSDVFQHLKKVEIKGFEGRGSEMFLVYILMKNALVLEDITIYRDAMNSRYDSVKCDGNQTKLKLLKEEHEDTIVDLLAFNEGSTRARILLI